ncbi:MAG: aspartate aminotransferase family protein [Bdellovibrionales bacterium]|nr:aspartate aminotransferase family protein [Bdellovibrionales bacterium]
MSADSVKYPDGHVLLRNLSRSFPVIDRGEGLYLFDKAGKKYIDASGGALVMSVGHGNQEVVAGITAQMQRVAYVNGTQFTSQAAEDLASRLTSMAPKGLDRAFFLSSGSEANEAAIKFARQLWVERGQGQRTKVVARTPGYHGNTLFALSASARNHYKKFYGPLLSDVVMVPAPYGYRAPVADYARDGGEYYARQFEDVINAEGSETIAAFIFEPVIGSSAGASVPPPGYFDRIQKLCRQHGILMIADEVMCGAGRTGKFYACEHFGLEPDLLVMGKGLNSGYVALSAVLVRDAHVREMKQGSGYFMHAQTYMQAPSMVATGLAVLNYMDKHRVIENAAKVGVHFQRALRERILPLPHVGNVEGLGLFAGVEFVDDKKSKVPFDRTRKFIEKFVEHAFGSGLIMWPNVGHADGVNGDLVMLGPPLNITTTQADEIVDTLARVIQSFPV